LEEFHNETIEFREWLLNKEGVNKGWFHYFIP
jgi:hypothetical protein